MVVPTGGDDPAKFGEAGIKGVVMNPIYTGIGQYPKYIADDQSIARARRILAEDGPDQFLVNLLYVLRRSFGCVEWDGNLPPELELTNHVAFEWSDVILGQFRPQLFAVRGVGKPDQATEWKAKLGLADLPADVFAPRWPTALAPSSSISFVLDKAA